MNEIEKKLIDHSVEYAAELLEETGESYPFAAYIDTVGNVHPLEMEIDKKNVPTIGKVVDILEKYCIEESEKETMQAYCLSYEVKVQLNENTTTDAIAFDCYFGKERLKKSYLLTFEYVDKKTWVEEEGFKKANVGELIGINTN